MDLTSSYRTYALGGYEPEFGPSWAEVYGPYSEGCNCIFRTSGARVCLRAATSFLARPRLHSLPLPPLRIPRAPPPPPRPPVDTPSAAAMAEQTEKAFLKQPKVFLSSKKSGKGKKPGKGGNRFWKSIGLGFKTPREAIEGTYIDKKCPFTGTVSIRGRIIAGTCHSAKMNRTIIVRRNYLHFRHSNIPAHVSPCFRVKEGDHVIIGQCRPLSKTVRFNVLKVIPAGSTGGSGGKKAFTAA
uniref:Small ribosomal subunit protein uS17 n=1 Tax=Oryza meridionalis TaxID=40149 RepID=A0A0E0DI98_9ORYZ